MKKEDRIISKKTVPFIGEIKLDPVIEIIKGMHCDPKRGEYYEVSYDEQQDIQWGIYKDQSCEELGISPRNFQNIINRLNKKNTTVEPIYICGQPVKVEITEERINHKELRKKQKERLRKNQRGNVEIDEEIIVNRKTHYCTPNSMHPVFLQLNVSQLAYLMRSLAHFAEESNSNIPYGLGTYVFWQLSEYAKKRIEEIYGKQDSVLMDFINALYDYPEDEIVSAFYSDEEFHEKLDHTFKDTLDLCCKNDDSCDIELNLNGNRMKYENVRIGFENNGYVLILDENERRFFTIENMIGICLKK